MSGEEPDFAALMERISEAIKAARCDAEKDPEAAAAAAHGAAETIGQETDVWVAFEVRDGRLYAIPPWRFCFQRLGQSRTQAKGARRRHSVRSRLRT